MTSTDIISQLSDLKHRIFPRPFDRLALHGADLVGAEIGVLRGEHAASLLKHATVQRLYLVDPYLGYTDFSQAEMDCARAQAQTRLASYGARAAWLYSTSLEAAKLLPPLDFAYIDGDHSYAAVFQDIATYWPLVRPGGVMGGHDFYNGYCREHDGVVQAVCEFAVSHSLPLQVELPDWWIVKPQGHA